MLIQHGANSAATPATNADINDVPISVSIVIILVLNCEIMSFATSFAALQDCDFYIRSTV